MVDRPDSGWRGGTIGLGLCVVAGTLSQLGDAMQGFALSWEATRYGAGTAGLVATIGALPRAALMLFGGALADRYGIRRMMIICDAAMAVAVAVAVGVLLLWDATLPVIVGLSVVGGIVAAFYQPAAGGFVRLFVSDERLPVVGARVSSVQQVARMIGPALGALSVVAFGLVGTLGANLAALLIIMVVLIMVRPPRRLAAPDVDSHPGRQVLIGLRQAVRTAGMLPALGSLTLVAGGVLPVIILGVPLLARERDWGAPAAGWIESGWIVGSMLVTLVLAKFGPARRMGRMIMVGPVLAAAGAVVIATASQVGVAVAGSVLMGIGTAVYTGHLAPLYLTWTPPELTARFQSLFGIVQAVPLVLINGPYGLLADGFGVRAALLASAVISFAAALLVGSNQRLRRATR